MGLATLHKQFGEGGVGIKEKKLRWDGGGGAEVFTGDGQG